MKPIYILLEVHPCRPVPEYVTDILTNRLHTLDWVDKQKTVCATIISEKQVAVLELME